MKDHKKKTVHVDTYACPLGDFLNQIFDATRGMIDVKLNHADYYELEFVGWVPMTELEIMQAAARRKASAAANKAKKAKKESEERVLLEKLKAKYEGPQ